MPIVDPFEAPKPASSAIKDPFDLQPPAAAVNPVQPQPVASNEPGDFARGLKRTLPELKQLGGGTLAAIGDVTGIDAIRDKGLEIYQAGQQVVSGLTKPTDSATEAFSQVKQGNLGAGADFLQNAAGYTTGQAIESIIAAGAGALIGGAAGTSAAPGPGSAVGGALGAVGGFVAKQGVKRAVKQQAEKIVAEQVARGVAKKEAKEAGAAFVAERTGKQALEAATGKLSGAQLRKRGGQVVGAVAGQQAMNTTMELGSVYPEALAKAQEEGRELTKGEKARAVTASLGAAGLESVADMVNLGILFRGTKNAVGDAAKEGIGAAVKRYAGRAAVAGIEGAAREAGTEAAQTFLERVGAGHSLNDADAWRDYIDSAAVGAVGGALFGGVAAFHPQQDQPSTRRVPEFGTDPADVLRANVLQATSPKARAEAAQALFDHLQAEGRLLPPPGVVLVDPAGNATTDAQASAAARAAQQAGVDLTQGRADLGLTPDVNAARAAHPGAVPNLPFPEAQPGTMASAANTLAAAAAGEAIAAAPPGIDPATGELLEQPGMAQPWSRDQVKAYLAAQLERGRPGALPKASTIATTYGMKPKDASALRREVIEESKRPATPAAAVSPAEEGASLEPKAAVPAPAPGSLLEGTAPVDRTASGSDAPDDSGPALGPASPGSSDLGPSAQDTPAAAAEPPSASNPAEAAAAAPTPPTESPRIRPAEEVAQPSPQATPAAEPVQGELAPRPAATAEAPAAPAAPAPGEAAAPSGATTALAVPAKTEGASEPASAQHVAPMGADRVNPLGAGGLNVRMGGQTLPIADLADAQQKMHQFRERAQMEGHGASTTPPVDIVNDAGEVVAHFSYNGRIWKGPRGASNPEEIVLDGQESAKDLFARFKREDAERAIESTAQAVDAAAHEAATSPQNNLPEPTDGQKEAGNYKKGHTRIGGLDISIENPAGSRRRPEWPPLAHHYGYIKGSIGKDKDHVDVFMTDEAADTARPVFVVDQRNTDGSFDEHKVILGAATEAEARKAYLANYSKGWKGLGAITQMTHDEFEAWVRDPNKTKRPASAPVPKKQAAPRHTDAAVVELVGRIAKGEHVEKVIPDDDATARAVAEALGIRFSKTAKASKIANNLGERSQVDLRRAAARAFEVTATPEQKGASPEAPTAPKRKQMSAEERQAEIRASFEANRKAIKDKGLKKGDTVTWTDSENTYNGVKGKTFTGKILSLGDSEQAVVSVGVEGPRGIADYHVPARDLLRASPGAARGITRAASPAPTEPETAPKPDKARLIPTRRADGGVEMRVEPVQPEAAAAPPGEDALHAALVKVSDWVAGELEAGRQISPKALFDRTNAEVGGTQAEGAYSPRDAYDALELGVNKAIKAGSFGNVGGLLPHEAAAALDGLRKLLNRLPTQSKRTKEQDEFQQFSTPPTLAFLAARAANLTAADTVLEPSAGTGDLVVMAQAAGARVVANELAPRRAALLRALGVEQVFTENAEQIDNILPDEIRPTVVLMNPPFSATAGRMGQGYRKTAVGAKHVEQALQRLAPGGRLVAIVGEGMAADRPAFRDWWRKIQKEYAVRANIGLSGKGYAKYGTTFDNQILVIDKTGPTTGEILTGKFDSAEAALPTIEALRNDAPDREAPGHREDAQRAAAEPARAEAAAEGGREAGRREPVPAATGGARAGKRAGRQLPEPEADAGRAAPDGDDGSGAGVPAADEQRGGRQPDAAVRGGADAGAGAAVPAGDAGGVAIEAADEPARASGKLTASIFEQYQPQRLRVPGAKPHPGALVQSAAMAAVEPPAPSYTPNLPKDVVTEGKLSLAQLESVVYAGQAHEQILPNGERRGFFIGDGTGVGKGREISGILLDNLRQGRGRAVWVSEKPGLLTDAKRDFGGVGGEVSLLTPQSKIKKDAAIDIDRGVLFTTYATLRQGSSVDGKAVKKAGASRVDQLVAWLGADFDGVIVFDEAHNAGNAVTMKGKRGKTKPSAQALAVVDLQKKLPNARVVYVSATGATEVSNLSYATRLGLWGEGTAFPSVESFINGIHEGGLAAMELVSRDMKALGVYTARSLSFDGVTYARLEHPLTDFQREVYDELARAWQGVLRNIDEALGITDADQNANAKAAAKAQFWGAQQRFFNQVLTAMQTPSVLTQIEADLAAGEAVVLQIVNTYEAAQTRALAEVENEDDLEALDITPRDGLIQYVRNSFPVAQYEEYIDEEGNKRSRPVTDSAGNPVLNKEAVRMREQLIENLQQIRVPESPLDMLLNHFGPDRVAEVTGRKRRVVRRPDPKTGVEKTVVQNRGSTAPAAEAAEFQAGKRDILIFSDAGGTGFSFHADRTAKNQKRRQHYLLQAGWRADKAVQGFGRTHRTNEASQPNYRLVTTDLPAQKRFLSSIARRLDQLGALTKGQRDTANQGLFSAKDNLESQYAQDAVTDFLQSLYRGRIEGMDFAEVSRELGFDNLIDKENGGLNVSKLPDVPQFLNRMLSLTVDRQSQVFDQFIQRLEARVDAAIADGTLDTGMQTIDAEKVRKVEEHVLYTDPRSGSQTKAVILELQHKVKLQRFPERVESYVRNANSHKVWAVRPLPDRTNREGVIEKMVELAGTGSRRIEKAEILRGDKFEEIQRDEARAAWDAENAKRPKFETERRMVLTGSLLPIWDRIKGDVKVVRAQTDDGERLIGRLVDRSAEADTLESFGVGVESKSADEIMASIMDKGETAQLANGWKLKRVRVSGEKRLEVVTSQSYLPNVQSEITRLGGFVERIQWAQRLFLPANDTDALARLLEARPFKGMVGDEEEGNAIRLSRPNGAGVRGMQHAELAKAVHQWTQGWTGDAPTVVPVATAQDLPGRARQADGWESAEGYYDEADGAVYLVAANLRDAARAERVLVHEAMGHYGIEAITSPALWAEIATTVRRMRDSGKHADLFAEIGRRYVGANDAIFVREAVAVMAEKGVRNSVMDRVIAALRRFLRNVLHLNLRLGEAELRQHIVAAARYVRDGSRPRRLDAGMSFSRPTLDPARQIPVTVLQGGKFGSVANNEARTKARARARDWLEGMRARGQTITNEDSGISIGFSRTGNQELIAWTARPERIELLAALPGVTRRALFAGYSEDVVAGARRRWATFYAPIQIAGDLRIAKLVARDAGNGAFYYDLQQSDVLETRNPAEAGSRGGGTPAPKAGPIRSMTVAQIREAANAVGRPGWGFSAADPVGSQAFQRWFGRSKVVDAGGAPRVVFHGTAEGFFAFDKDRLGRSTGHMSAPLGFFFAEDRGKAARYAAKAADGVPADERVIDAFLSIQRPKAMTSAELLEIESQDEARAMRAGLEAQGFDGIHLTDIGQWVAFEPSQVKSASENRGTFDPASSDIRFSRPDALDRVAARFRALTGDFPEQGLVRLSGVAVRNSQREAGNLGGNAEASPYNAEATALLRQWEAMRYPSSKYLFHTTPRANLASIAANGLVPNSPQRFQGVSNGRVSMAANEAVAAYYAGGDDVMLRINRKFKPKDLDADLLAGDGAYTTGEVVPPEAIEVKQGGRWVPLGEVSIEEVATGGMFSRPDPNAAIGAVDAAAAGMPEALADKAREAFRAIKPENLRENLRPAWLGALTLRHLAELGKDIKLAHVGRYAARVQKMATDRNVMQEEATEVSDMWETFQRKDRAGADATANLMHDATIAGVDPAADYRPLFTGATSRGGNELVTAESIGRRLDLVAQDLAETTSKTGRERLEQEAAELRSLLARERARAAAFPELVRRWLALPEDGKKVYIAARDAYAKQSDRLEQAIVERINATSADERTRQAFIAQVRLQFESARLEGPYFPLARFGEFWISAEDKKGEPQFFMYERVQDWRAAQRDLLAQGFVVKAAGRKIGEARGVAGASTGFMADLEKMLASAGIDEQTRDEVWQLYLRTLPELSMRKHYIHRKKTAGYSSDALRAFAGNMFHGSFQIARVRHTHALEAELLAMKEATAELAGTDPERAVKAAALTSEVNLRHEWVMNPKDSKAVSGITSLGFAWYLGVTPAAALVNLTQTAIVTFPVLAARFGASKAANALSAGMGRALRNVDGDLTRGLSAEESRAFQVWRDSGAIDRTLAHNLAGLSETDTRAFNPVARRAMNLVSFLFHRAEVVNREATALAAFRLARQSGQSFAEATQYAEEVITETHFDYTNANRARFMQSNAAKVLLLFRQYSLNMTWFLWRNAYLSWKGESKEVQAEARKKLAGVLGMTGVFAGALGMPLTSVLFGVVNAAAAAFGDDDDEPFDAEVAFRNFLADMLGPGIARVLTNGPVEALTGAEIGNRVSLNDLWLRDPDRELEGQAMADYLLEQAAGPVLGGMLVNSLRGWQMVQDGHTWRGVETMLPKAAKDGMKALRYTTQGVNTLRGDPIIEDLGVGQALLQLAGFSPASLNERYDAVNAAKGFEQGLMDRRARLLNAYAMAWRAEDNRTLERVLAKIQRWNAVNPDIPITTKTIRQSLAARMRYTSRAESGVVLDRRIAERAREQARFAQ